MRSFLRRCFLFFFVRPLRKTFIRICATIAAIVEATPLRRLVLGDPAGYHQNWLLSFVTPPPPSPPPLSLMSSGTFIPTGIGNSNSNSNGFLSSSSARRMLPTFRKKILILDLDETLIHSTLKQVPNHDLKVNVYIEGQSCVFYVLKRPYVDFFLRSASAWYHLVVFTASMRAYAGTCFSFIIPQFCFVFCVLIMMIFHPLFPLPDPVIDSLDPDGYIKERLFRTSCVSRRGNFLKDLSVVHKELSEIIIIDNSPIAYSLNPHNAIPIPNFFGNEADDALLNLLPFLDALRWTTDVRSILSLRN